MGRGVSCGVDASPASLRFALLPFDALSVDDLYACLRLRAEVFVVEQECAYQDLDGLDRHGLHVLARDVTGDLRGYARLLPPGVDFADACAIGRIVTSPTVRRAGAGRPLVRQALGHCRRLWPGVDVRIRAQTYLLGFYREFGFVEYGGEFLEDGLPHRLMVAAGA